MILYQSISYFRERLTSLKNVKRGVYATVEDEIRREFSDKPIEQIRINNDMILIEDTYITIKLRLPDRKHKLSKKDGYRLIYLVYKDRDEVAFLDIYPKNGPKQQLNENDEIIAMLIDLYATEKEAGTLVNFEI